MKISKTVNQVAYENTYYLETDQELILVDPGSNWDKIKETIQAINKPLIAILLTHTHYDHIMSLDLVRDQFNQPPVYIAESEATWLYSPQDNLSGLPRHDDLVDVCLRPAEHFFHYDQDYHLGDFHFYVRPTPGHSIGGVSIVFPDDHFVLTGDALFRQSIGRTDLPTGNQDQLLTSIKQELLTLPKTYDVYPGHGPQTSIAHEKMLNPFLSEK
ncbi:MBL fold metallo-hydrolase [Streptococcus oricebi]|uniref:MBL fold metallo-hydrolase n=1 Tax=Streptococcus oricebi TaxID=1547447 RepID=A0ABS5B122_9STRE|nr:MBL fold metallo-hydrolase [Streptococcus oricebi]